MSVFNKGGRKAQNEALNTDLSGLLKDPTSYALGHLASLGVGSEIASLAFGKPLLPSLAPPLRTALFPSLLPSRVARAELRPAANNTFSFFRLLPSRTDPVQSLLAVGTERGRIFIFGGPAVLLSWDIGSPLKIKHLAFRAGTGFLVCLGESFLILRDGIGGVKAY